MTAETAAELPMAEPTGMWAVIEHRAPGADSVSYFVKGLGYSGFGPYWYLLGGEDGWGWDQVTSWPGTVRLMRDGLPMPVVHAPVGKTELGYTRQVCKTCGVDWPCPDIVAFREEQS